MHARTHKFLHSHLKCCWDIVVFAAKTLHGTPNLICVCRQSNTFPELKASRESSNSFFKAGTMLVCYWLWYFTHIPLSFQWPWLHLAQIIWVCETFKKHCPQRGPYYNWSVKPGKEKMVGPHYTTEQRTFMALECARNQGMRILIELMMWEEDKFVSANAFIVFLGYFWFWMGDIEVVRWNRVDFLVPKHLRKSKIGLLEQIWA